jgi:hypothetical protein
VESYECLSESGSAAIVLSLSFSAGLRRRRRDHPYAARAHIPENIYVNPIAKKTKLEYRIMT